MNAKWTMVAATACVAGFSGIPAQASPITLTPEADAMIGGNATATGDLRDSNFGADRVMNVRVNSFSGIYKSYLRFDLSSIADLSQINAAALHLTSVSSNGTALAEWHDQIVSVYGLDNAPWGEGTGTVAAPVVDTSGTTITWNHAPANDTASNSGFLSPAALLGSFNADGTTGLYAFTSAALTQFLQNATGGGTVTFMLSTSASGIQPIGTRESSFDPSLEVTTPEPASGALALLGLGAMMMLGRKRRPLTSGA